MRLRPIIAFLSLLLLCGLAASAQAQMRLGLHADRTTYLLYEPLVAHLTIENQAGFDLLFQDSAEHAWLTFLITRADHSLVLPDRKIAGKDLKLAAGESINLDVDITPLYAMRETGPYKVQAVVDVGGREFISEPIQFSLVNGHRIWTDTRSVDGSPRTYSLMRFAPTMKGTYLYLRVEDSAQNLVYSNVLLGEIVDLEVPEILFDNAGQIHILQLAGNAVYRYTRADAAGTVVSQSVYDSINENVPHLFRDNGGVLVNGGRQENDTTRRERLSDNQSRVTPPKTGEPTGPFSPDAKRPPAPSAPTN
jgi:hypothetical protein